MEQEYAIQFFDGKVTSPENFYLIRKSTNPKWDRHKEEFKFIRLDGKPVIPEEPHPKEKDAWKDEVAQLMAELDELKRNSPPEEEPTLEEMKQESIEHYSSIPMYDFGLGQMSNHQAVADFYGPDLLRRVKDEIQKSYELPSDVRKTGQISKELWQELRDLRAGKKPRAKSLKKQQAPKQCSSREQHNSGIVSKPIPEPNSKKIELTQRERQPGDDYFMTIERGIIRNKSYREVFKGPSIIYEWIWANVVRGQWIDTNGYPIKEKYYDNGLLAFCSSYRQIAKACGLHKNKVKKYIDSFKDAGVVKVEHLVPQGKKRGQSVFIIGTWHSGKDENGKGKVFESYFIDEVFITKKRRSECAQLKLVKY